MSDKRHYVPGYGEPLVESYARRTADVDAAFFLPHLHPGMRVLDCGCGPGTIAAGLAEIVAPGIVVAVDVEPSQVERARRHARERGIANMTFEVASAYALPFDDASFDAVLAHAVLQHLRDPIGALREMHRVLKPGGVIGVRDDDIGSLLIAPSNPKIDRLLELLDKLSRHSGADRTIGRRHREVLRTAGFVRTEASATCQHNGTPEACERQGDLGAYLIETVGGPMAIREGWTTAEEVRDLAKACRESGRHSDAFDVITWCEALGWKAI